jgi:hypothetical protein
MNKKPCPVCGKVFTDKTLIYHMRKTAMFEIYVAYQNDDIGIFPIKGLAPHQYYIEENSKSVSKFTI